MKRVPLLMGWQARFSPTAACVAYCPHVEHQMVSSDNHLVCPRPTASPAATSAAASLAQRSDAERGQDLPAMLDQAAAEPADEALPPPRDKA